MNGVAELYAARKKLTDLKSEIEGLQKKVRILSWALEAAARRIRKLDSSNLHWRNW